MVRVNLIEPVRLSDQHLVAEYDEILMLAKYIEKYPDTGDLPETFRLGKGHMRFFKDKVLYLSKRHELLKKEMRNRGFVTNKTLDLMNFDERHLNNWKPGERDFKIIKERIISKLLLKPEFYRYYGEYKGGEFLVGLIG